MTLRLSLVIDGDAGSAKQAAQDTARAVGGIRDEAKGASAALNEMRAAAAQGFFSKGQISKSLDAQFGIGTSSAGRADDIAAYGSRLDDLRAKYSPLFALQRQYRSSLGEINSAARTGAMSEAEHAAAVKRTKDAFAAQVIALRESGNAAGQAAGAHAGLSGQAMALSHALRSSVEQMALGVPPTQILMQQFSHLSYAATGQGGLSGALGEVGGTLRQLPSWIASVMTPARLLTGAFAAIGVAGVLAATQFGDGQRQIQLALTGIGRAAGVTISDINRVARDSSSLTGLSVSEAREFATTLAATGKIGKDELAPLTKAGHDIALAFGVDAKQAADLLAKAFADPAKGAAELNQRLGFLDAAMLRNITNLQQQNQLDKAQAILRGGVISGLNGVKETVSTTTNAWTALGNSISYAWNALGNYVGRAAGLGSGDGEKLKQLVDKIADLRKRITDTEEHQKEIVNPRASLARLNKELEDTQAEYDKLQEKSDRYQRSVTDAQERQRSLTVGQAISDQLPDLAQLDALKNRFSLLSSAMIDVQLQGNNDAAALRIAGHSLTELGRALDDSRAKMEGFLAASDKAIAGLQLSIDAVGKRSPAALGNLAYQQALLALGEKSGFESAQGKLLAGKAQEFASKQASQQIIDAQKAGLLTAQQRVESARLELSILGQGSAEQERQRALLQARHELEQQSLRTYGTRDSYDRRHLAALEAEINKEAEIRRSLAAGQLSRDVGFEGEQIGRSSDEQQIANRLRGIYGDKYQSHMNDAIAGQMRLNQQLQFTHDIGQEAFKGFLSDLRQGKSLGEAFGNSMTGMLGRVEDKLAEMAFNGLWNAAFGGLTGGLAGGGFNIFKLFGFAGGGQMGAERWAVVGEEGPELVKTHAGGGVTVYSNEQSKRLLASGRLPGFADGGGFDRFGRTLAPPFAPSPRETMQQPSGRDQQVVYREGDHYTVHAPGASAEAMAVAFREIRALKRQQAKLPETLPAVWRKRPGISR